LDGEVPPALESLKEGLRDIEEAANVMDDAFLSALKAYKQK
jgi:predicted RNA polymerase sigma factor